MPTSRIHDAWSCTSGVTGSSAGVSTSAWPSCSARSCNGDIPGLLHKGTRLTVDGSSAAPPCRRTRFRRALRWVGVARGLAADTREDTLTAAHTCDGEE